LSLGTVPDFRVQTALPPGASGDQDDPGQWNKHLSSEREAVGMMTKKTITKWWVWGFVALIPAWILLMSGSISLAAHFKSVPTSEHGWFPDQYSRALVVAIIAGAILALVGIAMQSVAWMGAVVNAKQLPETNWFRVLLWIGIAGVASLPAFGFGLFIQWSLMIAYIVGAPDTLSVQSSDAWPNLLDKGVMKRWTSRGLGAMGAGATAALLVGYAGHPGSILHGHTWVTLALLMVCFSIAGVGVLAVFAAWWGALFNARYVTDRRWFNRLLWSGILGAATMPLLGLGAFIAGGVSMAFLHSAEDGKQRGLAAVNGHINDYRTSQPGEAAAT
jgi:hypothetical protein